MYACALGLKIMTCAGVHLFAKTILKEEKRVQRRGVGVRSADVMEDYKDDVCVVLMFNGYYGIGRGKERVAVRVRNGCGQEKNVNGQKRYHQWCSMWRYRSVAKSETRRITRLS